MYVIGVKVEINDVVFSRVHEVQIERSRKTLGAKATIKIPATARLERQGEFISEVETAKRFDRGDAVFIEAGYNGNMRLEFQGYVSRIKPGTPIEIECDDAIFLLRRKNLKAAFQNTTLAALLEFILKGTGIKVVGSTPGINFKTFYFKNTSAANALQKLKDEYGLTMYFRSINELFVGLAEEVDGTEVKYRLGWNVIDNTLEWHDEEDVRLKIKAIHIKKDNTKVEKEIGDDDGELRTLYFYDLENGADLERVAKQEMLKYKYSGYDGGLETFLLPNITAGNVVNLEDAQFEQRSGKYLADKVTTTIGTGGARRKIELGLKVS